MAWRWRILWWLCCGEWLLLLRRYPRPLVILLLSVLSLTRFWVLCWWTPAWYPYVMVHLVLIMAVPLWQCIILINWNTRRFRVRHQISDVGISRFARLGAGRTLSQMVLEPGAVLLLFFGLLAPQETTLFVPPLVPLPSVPVCAALAAGWNLLMQTYPREIATLLPIGSAVTLLLANLGEARALRPRQERPQQSTEAYAEVRLQQHATPALPSVRALAEDLATSDFAPRYSRFTE